MNVIELEQGSVVHAPDNGTFCLTNLTMALSTFGLMLSVCALVLLISTACLFVEWRKSFKNQLLIQFMLSRFYYTFVRYLFDMITIYNLRIKGGVVIYVVHITMIYSEAVLVVWMFVFTKQMYRSLVKVFSLTKPSVWKVSVASWLTPLFVSVISFMAFRSQEGNDLLFFFIYRALLKWPILIANAMLLLTILKSITKKNEINVENNAGNTRLVVVMNILIWSFCFQQVFIDIFKLLHIIFNLKPTLLLAYNIMTIYQCACSITFWVLGNTETRKLWSKSRFCTKDHRPILSESTV